MIRRTSSSKMYHMLTVEAPITKVIHILMSAKENSPLYVAQALDKVKNVVPTAEKESDALLCWNLRKNSIF